MPALTPDIPQVEQHIVAMTNAFRKEMKLGTVAPNAKLAEAARAYGTYLARNGAFSHTADGRQPADRAEAAGYAYCQVAENLALALDSRGFASEALARNAIDGWKASPGHRANLLAPHVTEVGVAVVPAPDKHPKYITVQLLGRPRDLQYAFKVQNLTRATVAYTFDGEREEIAPSMVVTHTACAPGAIAFEPAAAGRYEARNGQVYLLRPDGASGYKVEVGLAKK